MNGHEWLSYIKSRRPQYAITRTGLIKQFANKGASKGDYVQFGPIYQLFMYAFMLGFHQRVRIPLPVSAGEKTEFLEIGKWQPDSIVNYILMLLISHAPVRDEIGLSFPEMSTMDDMEVKDKFKKLISIMEEYANGGFSLLQDKFDSNPYYFNDSFAFASLLKEMADGKLGK